jgi:rhodanese-related sulfurtransferase
VRLVLCDEGDGVAAQAAARASGYSNLHILAGGKPAWRQAGYTLYAGVNVPSKAFGELIAHERHTPHISAHAVEAMRDAKEDFVIVDGRPFAEFRKMSIPGGTCCPNGELALRIREIAPDPKTKIVVNCAGRTRSIIGAQTLLEFGIPNQVLALENGTQGWFLAGLALEHGALRRHSDEIKSTDMAQLQAQARQFALMRNVATVAPPEAISWLADPARTTYLLDVRTAEEHAVQALPDFRHAPGGQLIQATDQWVGVRGARLVLADDELVRAPVVGRLVAPARLRGLRARRRHRGSSNAQLAAAVAATCPARFDSDRRERIGAGSRQWLGTDNRLATLDGVSPGPRRPGPVVDPPAYRGGGKARDHDRAGGR